MKTILTDQKERTILGFEISNFISNVKQTHNPNEPLVFWIDLFCGAGGTSTGIHFSGTGSHVAACVNHDTNAIKSHEKNHPNTLHFIEDIRDFKVVQKLQYLVAKLRHHFDGCQINLWASLECTNFSKAKGGQSRDADSRTLAEHMFMYINELHPDYFWVENVREFMSWGPLDDAGKPESRVAGKDYVKWIESIKSFGYRYDKKILNSADYGAYQSRERLFIQFAKFDYPITWPEQTHTKDKKEGGLFPMPKWKPVREVLDLDDQGKSIFERKKPLSENTLKRILAGLEKFVANGETTFIKKYYSGRPAGKVISVNGPAGSVTTIDGQAIVKAEPFTMQYNSGNDEHRVKSTDEPIRTITTGNSHALVSPEAFIVQRNNGEPKSKVVDVDGPARTLTATAGNQDLVNLQYLNTYYGNGGQHDVDEPAPTVTTKDRISKIDVKFLLDYQYNSAAHDLDNPSPTLLTKDKFAKVDIVFIDQQYGNSLPSSVEIPVGSLTGNPKFALVNSQFIMNQYSGGGQHTDINNPSSCVTAVPKQNLISCKPWIMNTNFNNVGKSIDDPAQTLTASRRHPYLVNANSSTSPAKGINEPAPSITSRTHLLINPSWFGYTTSTDEPSCTIIARQDKSPLYLLAAEYGQVAWIVFEDDTETMIKIKRFMVEYGITDIKMRMLNIPELKQIQGFPKDYKLIGTQTEQKKYIGNAVEVNQAKALILCNYKSIAKHIRSKAA